MIRKSNLALSDNAKAGIRKLCDDFELWASNVACIRTKDGQTSKLVLNAVQKRLYTLAEKQMQSEGKVRIVILKARQQGLSTFVSAYLFHRLMQSASKKGYIVAHKADSTNALWTLYSRLYNRLPDALQPVTARASQKEMVFAELDTSFSLATAGGNSIARGETITHGHLSEMAFWPGSNDENFNALMQCIPDAKDTVIFVESTANGMGGKFYDLWQGACRGENGFLPFFSAWFETEEYREPAPDTFERTFEEMELAEKFGLDNDQLQWRRTKIATSGRDLFEQEYPSTADEAFKTSGMPVFPPEHIDEMASKAKPVIKRMQVMPNSVVENSAGALRVYVEKDPGEVYTIGADVAGGGQGGDYSVAQVLDGNGEQVAVWRSRVDPEFFADILAALGSYYNLATIAVESNMHGRSTNIHLNSDHAYPKLYTEFIENKTTEQETKRLGFLTSHASKPPLIDALRAAIREGQIIIHDRDTLDELKQYIFKPSGRMCAQPGAHDDTVMALAIAWKCLDRSFTPIDVTDDFYTPVYY